MSILKRTTIFIRIYFSMLVLPFPAATLDQVTLAYSPSLSFAPLFIAIEKEYLKEQGIEIKLEMFRSGSEAVAFAASGQIAGIAGGFGASTFNGASKNMGVKIVAPMASEARPVQAVIHVHPMRCHSERSGDPQPCHPMGTP